MMQPTSHNTVIVHNQPVYPQVPLSKTHKIIRWINFALFPVLFIGFAISGFIAASLFTFVPPLVCFCLFALNIFFCAGHNMYLHNRNVRHYTQSQQNAALGTGEIGQQSSAGIPVVQPGANVLHPPPQGLAYSGIPPNESYNAAAWPAYNPAVYPPNLPDQSVPPPMSAGVGTVYPPPSAPNPDLPPSYDKV